MADNKLVVRDDPGWEQVVGCEMIIPDTPNAYGDIWTEAAIRECAYQFAMQGYTLDIEHDNKDHKGEYYVVESFIAREGDPDFIKGSWVIFVKIIDASLWQQVLDGKINGFSYEAEVEALPVGIENLRNRTIIGITSPDPVDGHTHTYAVVVNALNKPISGSTGVTDSHWHPITTHTVTGKVNGHTHRFDVLNNGENNDS